MIGETELSAARRGVRVQANGIRRQLDALTAGFPTLEELEAVNATLRAVRATLNTAVTALADGDPS